MVGNGEGRIRNRNGEGRIGIEKMSWNGEGRVGNREDGEEWRRGNLEQKR
jgi:hypothetical protein